MSRIGLALTTIGMIVASWLGWVYATPEVPDAPIASDRVRTAAAALESSHVYVDPDSEGLLTPAEIAEIDAAASASKPEAFVVLWRESSEAGYYTSTQGVDLIGAELGKPGFYMTAGTKGISSDEVGIKSDDYISSYDVDEEDGLADQLLALIDKNDGRDFSVGSTTGSDYWGGTVGTIAAGALIGSLIGAGLAGIFAIAWFIERGRRKS